MTISKISIRDEAILRILLSLNLTANLTWDNTGTCNVVGSSTLKVLGTSYVVTQRSEGPVTYTNPISM